MARKRQNAQLSRVKQMDQRTVETTLYEPRLIADKSSVSRIFQAIDAAQAGNTTDLFTLYRDFVLGDSHVQTELGKRKLAVLGDSISVAPKSPTETLDKQAAEFIAGIIPDGIPRWRHVCSALLDSVLWPVSVAEKVFAIEDGRFVIDKIVPVPHHLLDFSAGRLRIQKTDATGIPLTEYWEPELEPERYIIHRGHLLNMPDHFGGPMRSILFWVLFRTCDRDWWIRFLERFGSPFMVGKYDAGDDNTRTLLQQAFSAATKLFGIAVSKDVEIDLKEANMANGDAFKSFMAVANDEISRLIVGQTLSSTASPTGMNSGVSALQGEVRADLRDFDSAMLIECIDDCLVEQLLEINGFDGDVTLSWGSSSIKRIRENVGLLKDLYGAGMTPTDESMVNISNVVGYNLQRISTASPVNVLPMSSDAMMYRRRKE